MSTTPHANPDTPTREAWLLKAIDYYMRPLFRQAGFPLPDVIHVSVGFPYGKQTGESKDLAGECWSGVHSPDGYPHIYISPFVADAVEALCVLMHDCIHAALDPDMTHSDTFKEAAHVLGLVGRMDATTGDAALKAVFADMVATDTDPDDPDRGVLGPYPHRALELLPSLAVNDPAKVITGGKAASRRRGKRTTSGAARQENRHLRVRCEQHPDAPRVSTAASTIRAGRGPLCGEPVPVPAEEIAADPTAPTTRPCGQRMTAKLDSEEVADEGVTGVGA